MLPDPFIGQFIRSLISELKRLSNKQFRDECRLDPVEVLGVEKRISLNALVLGKISIAQSLTELSSEIHSAGQFLTLNHQIKYGYERVYLKYHELLNQRWVLAADKYKEGYDPNPKLEFRTCAYGLIEIDLELLAELRSILDEAEQVIREAPLPDLVPQFRIDHLATDLQNAGIPLAGLNVADKPSPESDATPCEYFKLENGKFVRVTKEADVTFTDAEKQLANEIILAHEQEIEKRDKILESVRLGLIRDGHKVSSVRFTRHATELTYDPEKFISIDTEIDILEIRVPEPLNRQQRELIIKTTHTILVSHDVKTSLTEDNKQQTPKDPKKIFVVHGHHTEMRLAVSLMLTKLHLKPVILGERVNQGKTIIEKFEANSDVGFAVVLMSADDMAYLKTSDPSTALPRPRQNVIFELGFFIAKLDRVKIAILKEDIPELEILTDLSGIAYISYKDDWQNQLFRELEAAGYDIDARNLI